MPESGGVNWNQLEAIVRRRWHWLLVAPTIVVLISLAVAVQRPASYASSAKVAVEPASTRGELERLIFGERDLGTQIEILTSKPLVARVLREEGLPAGDAEIDQFIRDQVTVERIRDTTVLEVSVSAKDPERAARLAQGMADSYLEYLREDAEQRTMEAMQDLSTAETTTRQSLRSVERQLEDGAGTTEESLEEARDELYAQLRWIATRRAELETADAFIRRGDIIEPATVPSDSSSPGILRTGAAAVLVGIVSGLGMAALREAQDDRIRDAASLQSMGVGPVVGSVELGDASRAWLAGPPHKLPDAFRRLRSSLLALEGSLHPGHLRLALIPAGPEGDVASLTLNLAAALARSGHNVAVIDAALDRSAVGPIVGIEGPGLRELLTGRVSALSGVLRRIAGIEIVSAGTDPDDVSDLLASDSFRALVDELSHTGRDVLVVGPRADGRAHAMDVAGQVGAAVLLITLGATTVGEARAAVEDLQRVGVVILGFIVISGRSSASTIDDRPPSAGAASDETPSKTLFIDSSS